MQTLANDNSQYIFECDTHCQKLVHWQSGCVFEVETKQQPCTISTDGALAIARRAGECGPAVLDARHAARPRNGGGDGEGGRAARVLGRVAESSSRRELELVSRPGHRRLVRAAQACPTHGSSEAGDLGRGAHPRDNNKKYYHPQVASPVHVPTALPVCAPACGAEGPRFQRVARERNKYGQLAGFPDEVARSKASPAGWMCLREGTPDVGGRE
ncbi:hypothetical protein T492DRAFT_982784 [Pavlovales sp. CCMP2436]|nr:hypothetical protein T492DRAFT_982784 [Pavlovales sp. CCMP2436]|mmetsp:Transcript_10130/g.24394  ORF Transcript_10130/g.24394 Transcript_10130/m.24394 type:complete len:214 (-) Transcript_10130:469-1110(-)